MGIDGTPWRTQPVELTCGRHDGSANACAQHQSREEKLVFHWAEFPGLEGPLSPKCTATQGIRVG